MSDTTRATTETAMLTRKEYAERINDAYFDQGMGMATRDVLMHHDAAFRERDERQRERIVKLRAALREAREYVECFANGDSDGCMGAEKVDIPADGYPRQYAVRAAPETLKRIDAALADEKGENRG